MPLPQEPKLSPLVASLIVPACLLAAWAWLAHGGTIARAQAEERAIAERAVGDVAGRWRQEVLAAAAGEGAGRAFVQLDAGGQPIVPFCRWPEHVMRAAGDGVDPGELQLALARSLASEQRFAEARAVLAAARAAGHRAAPQPFEVVAGLLDARIAAAAGTLAPAQAMRRDLLRGRITLPAAAARPVLAELDALLQREEAGGAAEAFLAAAVVAARLQDRDAEPPQGWTAGPADTLIVPLAGGLAVLAPARWRDALATARSAASGAVVSTDAGDALASSSLEPFDLQLHARMDGPRTSSRLALLANVLLGLAALTFAAGNLWAARVARKERRLARMKGAFVDIVSHELRTPLQALALRTEMLAAGEVPPPRLAEYHHVAHEQVLRLAASLRRILDFARLENGAVLQREPVAVRPFLARCVRESRALLRSHGQRLAIEAPRRLPELVGEADLLACAVRNLLENAAKYSPRGSRLTLVAAPDGAAVRIAVGDAGPGVDEGEREAIFDPFRRGVAARRSGSAGSGLGLAIVASAASRHGGSVEVRNRPDGGAEFTLVLPASGGAAGTVPA